MDGFSELLLSQKPFFSRFGLFAIGCDLFLVIVDLVGHATSELVTSLDSVALARDV